MALVRLGWVAAGRRGWEHGAVQGNVIARVVMGAGVLGLVVALVSWFWPGRRGGGGGWSVDGVEPPWRGGPSIHDHIRAHIAPGRPGLTEGGEELPDEKEDGGLRWVAGGMDGVSSHHMAGGGDARRAKRLHRALRDVLREPAPAALRRLYELLLDGSAIGLVDPLLERAAGGQDLPADRLGELARWIARDAPDREPVKVALALLGAAGGPEDIDLVATLGRHEELTLYVGVALMKLGGDRAEELVFDLAQQVSGWGRIHLVERLAGTGSPAIQAWMLREGYRNDVMIEYLAHICATTGRLRQALEADEVDPALLTGAGELIEALIAGGPAEDMDDYDDGAAVVERYVHHLGAEPRGLDQLVIVDQIGRFLDGDGDWAARAGRGWTTARREALRARTREIIAAPHWPDAVRAGLAASDPDTFHAASRAAGILDIDTWDHQFARLEAGDEHAWYAVMQTDDPARIDRVVAHAERALPLEDIATGPAEELGFGPAWRSHGHLDVVLQDLRRFPGKGWPLLRAGLQSPVVRNRHMALRALSAWSRPAWPPDAESTLIQARDREPDPDVRRASSQSSPAPRSARRPSRTTALRSADRSITRP